MVQNTESTECCAGLVRLEWVAEVAGQGLNSGLKAERLPKQRTLRLFIWPPKTALCLTLDRRPKKKQQFRSFFARMVEPGKFTVPVTRVSISAAKCYSQQRGEDKGFLALRDQ